MNGKIIRSGVLFLLLLIIAVALFGLQLKVSRAQTPQELASTYAPVLHFTGGEKFYPTSVDYIIGSSALKLRNPNGTSTPVNSNPTVNNLGSDPNPNLFLDNKNSTFDAISADYGSKASTIGYYAYVHIVNTASGRVIQYWLFYAYNNGPFNDHQGDIEVVEVFLDASGTPQTALYSQHGSGENAGWGDVDKVDTHPVVYVAEGSHANYFRSYQGKIGIENDIVGSDGKTIMPADLTLVMLTSQSWLNFAGRWGFWGTDEDAALGRAGPLGPVFNQDGIRWASPETYLSQTFGVGGNYFILAWLAYYFLWIFVAYVVIRAGWKIYGIVKLQRKRGLMVKYFLKGRVGIGLMLGVVAIAITIAGLFLPWYTISASSQSGPLAQKGGVTLLNIDGISGMQVNLFFGGGDSPSGYTSLFSLQIPFAILIGVGVVLLALDVIGIKSGKSLGLKLMLGAITSLLPFILILIFIMQLPSFLPWASQLVPGQSIPPQLDTMVNTIAGSPALGSMSETFPVVGVTSVNWGFGIGAVLFVVAAVIRIVGGFVMRSASKLEVLPPPPPARLKTPPDTSKPKDAPPKPKDTSGTSRKE
jgi:hypothetical protein